LIIHKECLRHLLRKIGPRRVRALWHNTNVDYSEECTIVTN
jgi:hypothetical protein